MVLTGPIPKFIATDHSNDAVVNPTVFEKELLEEKRAMQFMQSLVDMDMQVNIDSESEDHDESKPVSQYKALDYWAAEFSSRGGVIVRRDVGYAETGLQHTVGGVQV